MATVDDIGVPGQPATNLTAWQAAVRDAIKANTTAVGLKVAKAGDTMTGSLVLPGNPSTALQATPKQYVDAKQAGAYFWGHNPTSTGGAVVTWKSGAAYGTGTQAIFASGLIVVPPGVYQITWLLNGGESSSVYASYWTGTGWATIITGVNTRAGHCMAQWGASTTVAFIYGAGPGIISDGAGSFFSAVKVG